MYARLRSQAGAGGGVVIEACYEQKTCTAIYTSRHRSMHTMYYLQTSFELGTYCAIII